MKKIFFFLFFVLYTYTAHGIYPIIRNFTRHQYKAGTQNWDVTQNESRCLYFANNGGLLEFDGQHWSLYPVLNHTSVRSVMFDKETNRIYAGASNEFGYYTYNTIGKLEYTTLVEETMDWDRIGEVWNIHQQGRLIWFQGDYNLYKYNQDSISVVSFNHKIDCSALVFGTLIASTREEGPVMLSGSMFVKFKGYELLLNKKVCGILPYKENEILFVTDLHGVFHYNGQEIIPFSIDIDSFLKTNQVFSACINEDYIAFGTVQNGLVLKNLHDNLTLYANIASGMQNNTILNMGFDQDHNLWLCLDKGIDYVMINSPEYYLFGSSTLYGSGYTSVLYDNKLYLGTNQGLYSLDYPLPKEATDKNAQLINGLQGQVWCLERIDNTLFCGHDRGLFIIEKSQVKPISGVRSALQVLNLKHYPGYILGSSYHEIFLLQKKGTEWIYAGSLKGFDETDGRMLEDEYGNIWFRHWIKGLFKLSLNKNSEEPEVMNMEYFGMNKGLPTNVLNRPFYFQGQTILATENGYYGYDEKRDTTYYFSALNNLFSSLPVSLGIHESPIGDILFVSDAFMGFATRDESDSTAFKIDSLSLNYIPNKLIIGFEDINFIENNSALISTEDGFSWINFNKIKELQKRKSAHEVYIRNIYCTNNGDSLLYGERKVNPEKHPHILPYKYNSLRFEFITPEFRREDANTYSYYLENYDKEWSDFSSTNTKEYTQLREGKYIFRVKSKNVFYPEIAEYEYAFEILPPWYRSTIAYILYMVCFFSVLWVFIRLINRQSRKKISSLEAQKNKLEEDKEKKEKEIFRLKNEKLEYDLKHKSQELANSTINLVRKNEILMKIRNDLEKINPYLDDSPEMSKIKKQLTKIHIEIRNNIESDHDWFRFEHNFDVVYEDFFKRLSKEFPQLNTNDKKLCAYLKMNLSSKDIASLLNISVRSVEMARYRLRKKMFLQRDINLSDYFQRY